MTRCWTVETWRSPWDPGSAQPAHPQLEGFGGARDELEVAVDDLRGVATAEHASNGSSETTPLDSESEPFQASAVATSAAWRSGANAAQIRAHVASSSGSPP